MNRRQRDQRWCPTQRDQPLTDRQTRQGPSQHRTLRRRTRDRQRLLTNEYQPNRERGTPTRRVDHRGHESDLRPDPQMQADTTLRRLVPPKARRRCEQLPAHQEQWNQPDRRPSHEMYLSQPQDRDRSQRPHKEDRREMHSVRLTRDEPTQPARHHHRPSTPSKTPLTAPSLGAERPNPHSHPTAPHGPQRLPVRWPPDGPAVETRRAEPTTGGPASEQSRRGRKHTRGTHGTVAA